MATKKKAKKAAPKTVNLRLTLDEASRLWRFVNNVRIGRELAISSYSYVEEVGLPETTGEDICTIDSLVYHKLSEKLQLDDE